MRNYKTLYTSDGSTKQFNITFPYLRKGHVHAYVNDKEQTFRWINDGRIELTETPESQASVKIQRQTPSIPIHLIQNNRPTPAEHYNELTQQALYRAEEMESDDILESTKNYAKKAEDSENRAATTLNKVIQNGDKFINLASQWASAPEDGKLINDGKNKPNHSAYHWAMKSYKSSIASQSFSDKAQDLITAVSASTVGYPNGTHLDLGHVTDKFQLFDTDLGNI